MSNDDDEIDDLDGSMVWSQEDSLSANEIMELEAPTRTSGPGASGDADVLCRLCAGVAINPIYIYSEMGESMKLAHKVNTCLSVKVRITSTTILFQIRFRKGSMTESLFGVFNDFKDKNS